MKILIVEDEIPAAEKLKRYLHKYDPAIEVMDIITSVKKAASWLSMEEHRPDVIFMDIQLSDGISFEIFGLVEVKCPVIFATAHDDYALDAFKVNSIDYIMKPITYMEVSKALKKLNTLSSQLVKLDVISGLTQSVQSKKTKDRFVVKKGNQIQSIKTSDIQLFYAEGRTVFLVTNDNQRYIIDFNLADLEGLVPSSSFYRINRSFIVNINGIVKINQYSNSRLKLITKYEAPSDIIVSRERVSDFKEWLEGGG